MSLSAPWPGFLVIFILQTVKRNLGVNPKGCSSPWADYLDIIALDPVNKHC